jgi:hypothetical protein
MREVVQQTRAHLAQLPAQATRHRGGLSAFISRLYWHCHFIQKLESEPAIEWHNMHRGYDGLRELAFNPRHFEALKAARTGWPMVDASVTMLRETGWLNFRMRTMLVSASSPSGGRQADMMRQYFEAGAPKIARGSFYDWFGPPLEKATAELAQIVTRSASILGIRLDPQGAEEIARRSRGTPRIANRLLRRVRDFAEVEGNGVVTRSIADKALARLEVDARGLDPMDRKILRTICEKFGGGPVGLETIASAVGEQGDTVEDVYEPFLLQEGFIHRTPRGRVATPRAFEHVGMKPPGPAQGFIF